MYKLQIPYQSRFKNALVRGAEAWNSLPNSLKSVDGVNNFKHKSKELFFDILRAREEDPYIYY